MPLKVGITEYIDASINTSWQKWALEKREPTILITKNVKKLLEDFPGIENQNNILVHATITGYGGSIFEPGVPKPAELLEYLKTKSLERIILRIDPIIPIITFVLQSKNVYDTGEKLGFKRFRVSIMDLYPFVLKRFEKYPLIKHKLKDIYNWDMTHSLGEDKEYMHHAPFNLRQEILKGFPKAEICGEPGFQCQGCISKKDLEMFGIKPDSRYPKCEQREFCSCLGVKKEFGALKEECPYHCIYCYKVTE
jgi:DNA repair photolyase